MQRCRSACSRSRRRPALPCARAADRIHRLPRRVSGADGRRPLRERDRERRRRHGLPPVLRAADAILDGREPVPAARRAAHRSGAARIRIRRFPRCSRSRSPPLSVRDRGSARHGRARRRRAGDPVRARRARLALLRARCCSGRRSSRRSRRRTSRSGSRCCAARSPGDSATALASGRAQHRRDARGEVLPLAARRLARSDAPDR